MRQTEIERRAALVAYLFYMTLDDEPCEVYWGAGGPSRLGGNLVGAYTKDASLHRFIEDLALAAREGE